MYQVLVLVYPTDQPRDQDPARNVESSSCIMLVETDGHNVLLSYTVESVFFVSGGKGGDEQRYSI